MDSHDPKRIVTGWTHQNWRAFRPVMHLHENHYTKRAGVAGIRARATVGNGEKQRSFQLSGGCNL
ncbi:hypothetical protein M8014_08920 [Enterobacteriaceae bacterium H19S6]|uniref:Uncharacterized protein n=1 Tax=Silvania hatchlandensis TaxID=2926469 RepID=A0A9J6Q5A6_9ENTR|nr:hypothetical protein [Silvania hatchlandensis]MCU6664466.1 hypothetical protein [Silvania hatchlandensis]